MDIQQHLRSGGTVLHATETCYGFACDITNQKAVEQLFTLKQRDHSKPVSALFATVEMAKQYVQWNNLADSLAATYLPGPLTMILPLRDDAPQTLFPTPNGGTTIGVRLSSHPAAQVLVEHFGAPLVTTSANVAGQPCCFTTDEVIAQFEHDAHGKNIVQQFALVDDGPLDLQKTSTVVDICDEKIKIVRPGFIEL